MWSHHYWGFLSSNLDGGNNLGLPLYRLCVTSRASTGGSVEAKAVETSICCVGWLVWHDVTVGCWLAWDVPELLWIYGAAIATLAIDLWAVSQKQQKSIPNEITMFAAICLSTPLAFGATVGTITPQAMGLWILNTLFFVTSIFTIKFRKGKASTWEGGSYLMVAVVMVLGLYGFGYLNGLTALTFAIAPLKFGLVVWLQDWYRTCHFGAIARFESYFALSYICLVALTILPARLPVT